MLDASHAAAVTAAFGLGRVEAFTGPVAHGRLGSVWRLETERGRFAVKTFREPPEPDLAEHDSLLQEPFLAAGIPMPTVVRCVDGTVLGAVAGQPVRVYTWVDVAAEDRHLDPTAVGQLLAAMHTVGQPTDGPVDDWYTAPVGADVWSGLVRDLRAADCGFADRLAALVPSVLEVEAVLRAPTTGLLVCHRDLWADNLRAGATGGLVALDWENAGPASPGQELGVVLFEYGAGAANRIRALHAAYVEAGGPGRLREPGDFTMLLAQQGAMVRTGCRRWLAATSTAERADNEAWVAEFLDDPVLLETVEEMLAAVR